MLTREHPKLFLLELDVFVQHSVAELTVVNSKFFLYSYVYNFLLMTTIMARGISDDFHIRD